MVDTKTDMMKFFGEDFAKNEIIKKPLVNEYVFPDIKNGDIIFTKIALELLKENNDELKSKGFVYLDDAYLRTKNEKIVNIRNQLPNLIKPFASNSIYILMIGSDQGQPQFLKEKDGETPSILLKWACMNNKEYLDPQYGNCSLSINLGPNCLAKIKELYKEANPQTGEVVSNNAVWCLGLGKELKKETYELKKDTKTKKKGETGETIKLKLEYIIPFPSQSA